MPRAKPLTVVTYNIHKGLSQFNRRLVLHEIRDRLKTLEADVAFLQEVQGKHDANARRHMLWPETGQHEFLTYEGCHSVYGMNAVYQDGHHGNAVVSRHPI
ncbi:MAG TPA: endonuclease/exonuclease/phosphatase family protein, partial [Usitatibacter sp.]|nr:endonuclease/exonuclease/phosphatase family protein [Usitatibacter sp.]